MALTTDQQNQIRALVVQDGLSTLHGEIDSLIVADQVAAAITSLPNFGTVTITNWDAIAAFLPTVHSSAIPTLMVELTAAMTAHNEEQFGALLVTLWGACKSNLGM